MSSENTVDPNTDDLDAFSLLMSGQAKAKTETDDEKTPVDDTHETETAIEEELPEEEAEVEAEEEEEAKAEAEPEQKTKPKSPTQKRIDELVAARVASEQVRQADRLEFERKIAELSAKVEAEKAPAPAKTDDEAPKPDALDAKGEAVYPLGEFDPQFIRDITRFTIRKETELAKVEAANEAQRASQEAARTALTSEWSEKLSKAPEKYPDIAESNQALQSTFTNIDPAYGEYLAATIMSLDHGVDVIAYLGKNLDEAKAIVASGPTKATLALGRLEARFVTEPEAKASTTKVSKASPPPQARARGTGNSGRVAADTDDLDAFEKLYFSR